MPHSSNHPSMRHRETGTVPIKAVSRGLHTGTDVRASCVCSRQHLTPFGNGEVSVLSRLSVAGGACLVLLAVVDVRRLLRSAVLARPRSRG